eukprot:TRINITY_DN557_c0_g4_i2.p1 TRINITY_DN557_c0_g4~~TRINITY_DN557_c0_g4_i2.p1  ORF type:complete len:798 (+),score=147.74 TRINITY_DN557_c0_g4_i2:193-2586(+)
MTHSVRSFHSGVSTVLPYTPSVASSAHHIPTAQHQRPSAAPPIPRQCDMHPLFLWFFKDEKLESQFRVFYADRQKRTLQRIYVALFVILCLVLGFRIEETDKGDLAAVVVCSVFTILCPLGLLVLSVTNRFRKWFVPATIIAGVVTSICYVRVTSFDDNFEHSVATVVYLICAYSFLLGLTFPAVVFLNVCVVINAMVQWSVDDLFIDRNHTITILFRLIITSVLFSYAAYRQDYLFRRVFLSTFQLRSDNKGLKDEIEKLKQPEPTKAEVDLESPLAKVIYVMKELRQTAATKMLIAKESISKLDAAIEILVHNHDIFTPNISSQILSGKIQVDSDVQTWLFSEVASKEARAASPASTQEVQRRPSLGSVVKRRRSSGTRTLGLFHSNIRTCELQELNADESYAVSSFLENYVDQWDFNIFNFAEKCQGRPLYHLANYLFRRYQLLSKFDIDAQKFDTFLGIVESGYHSDNPYHNSIHAADVLQSTHQILVQSGLITFFDDMEILSLLVAAIVHDIDHPGRTNIFMVASESEYALVYNDKSVLENHHSSTAFRVIRDPRSNILDNIPKQDRKTLRSTIIELVLATDLSQHFAIVGQFKSKLDSEDLRTAKENRMMIMKMIIKCADVSNPAKIDSIYHPWVARIMDEFYNQGDEETRLTLPISPFMDRNNPTVEKCQCGFIDFIVRPLYDAWCNFIRDQTYVQLVDSNKKYYASRLEAIMQPAALASAPAPAPAPAPAQNTTPASVPSSQPQTTSGSTNASATTTTATNQPSSTSAQNSTPNPTPITPVSLNTPKGA